MEPAARKIIFKIKLGDDLRRWTSDDGSLSFETVVTKVCRLFGVPSDDTLLRYQDDDEDWVTLAGQDDLQEAISIADSVQTSGSKLTIRLDVTSPKPVRATPLPTPVATPRLTELEETVTPRLAEMEEAVKRLEQEARKAAHEAKESAKDFLNSEGKKLVEQVQDQLKSAQARCPVSQGDVSRIVEQAVARCEEAVAAMTPRPMAPEPTETKTTEKDEQLELSIHPGVTCDVSGMYPIVGTRYKKKGANYDLCETEFAKLDAEQQTQFIRIEHPQQVWRCRSHCGTRPTGNCHPRGRGQHRDPQHRSRPQQKSQKPSARFVEDVNIPENTEILPGTQFTKIWRLRNSGTEPWPSDTQLIHIGGDKFEGDTWAPVSPAAPGQEIDVAVSLVAPLQPGRYVSYWRLAEPPHMRKFGQRIWVQVVIVNSDGSVEFENSETTTEEASSSAPEVPVLHLGVECDVSGMHPLIGARYHKIGCDYDLCEAEFSKLDRRAQRDFERIAHPGDEPVRMGCPEDSVPQLPPVSQETITDELEARHGWSAGAISAVQHSALASTVQTLSTVLPAPVFEDLVRVLDPVFRVPEAVIARCLDNLDPFVASVAADPTALETLRDVVSTLVSDPEAFAAGEPSEPVYEDALESNLDMMDCLGRYECSTFAAADRNDWHYVQLLASPDGAHMLWRNAAGVEWPLFPTEDQVTYRVNEECPYFPEHAEVAIILSTQGEVEALTGPAGEIYSLVQVDHALEVDATEVRTVVGCHPFPLVVRDPLTTHASHNGRWFCDGCRQRDPAGAMWHCSAGNDFDLCERCLEIHTVGVGQPPQPEPEPSSSAAAAEVIVDEEIEPESPVTMQEALADLGIAQADLSASMLAEMEAVTTAEQVGVRDATSPEEEARAEAEAVLAAAESEVAPMMMADVMAAMGVDEGDLTASMCAEIHEALQSNADNAEQQAMQQSAKEADEAAEAARVAAEAAEEGARIAAEEEAARVAAAEEAARIAAEEEAARVAAAEEAARIAAEEEAARIAAEEEAARVAAAEEAARIAAEEEASRIAAEEEAARVAAAEEAARVAAEEEAARVAAAEEAARIAAEEEAARVAAAAAAAAAADPLVDPLVEQLVCMGFETSQARSALSAAQGNMEEAVNMLLSNPEAFAAEMQVEPVWNSEWDEMLIELEEMGFEDTAVNRQVLIDADGDVKDAVKELVNRERLSRGME